MRTHPDTDHAELGDSPLSCKPFGADFRDDRPEMFFYSRQFIREGGKGNIGVAGGRDVLHDHVDVYVNGRNLTKNSRGNTRLVRYPTDRDFCLSAVYAHSADDYFLHSGRFFFHKGSWLIVKAAPYFENNREFFGKLDRARLHDLRSEAGHFEHFIIGNF